MPADIRPARASDIDALLDIENAVFRGDRMSRASFRRLVGSPSAALIVAAESAVVIGYCAVFFRAHAKVARLYSIAVRPQTTGVGRDLLAAAEKAAAGRGARRLRLEVRADNPRAIALYEKSGYLRIGEIENYYDDGATALRYEKQLRALSPAIAPVPAAEAERQNAR